MEKPAEIDQQLMRATIEVGGELLVIKVQAAIGATPAAALSTPELLKLIEGILPDFLASAAEVYAKAATTPA